MGTDGYRPPAVRRAGTAVLSVAVSLATRRKTTDTTSGFRALNRKALSLLAGQYPDGYAETESLVLMRKLGIRWIEVPVSMRRRAHGKSTIRGLHSLAFVTNTLFRIVLVAGKRTSGRYLEYARLPARGRRHARIRTFDVPVTQARKVTPASVTGREQAQPSSQSTR